MLAQLVSLGFQVYQAQRVKKVFRGLVDQLARKGLKEMREILDPEVMRGLEETLVLHEQRGRRESRAILEIPECLVYLGSKVLKDRREKREIKVTRDLMETKA